MTCRRSSLARTPPDFTGWRQNVDQALADFDRGHLEKAVLARRATLEFEEEPDPALIARKLKDSTPDCFHFYFEPENGAAFIGASPERLFRREGDVILSGGRRRAPVPAELRR